jgi:hypothetical protein
MPPSFDRRRSQRLSIPLKLQFTIRKHGKVIGGGEGKIQDVSRSGIFFESNIVVPPGSVLRLTVDWPIRFQNKTRVDWIVDAVVVRSTLSGMAISIMRQRFDRRLQGKEKKLAG